MTKFLIQTINGQVKHDFNFHLIESIEYNNWFYNDKVYEYVLSDEINSYVDYTPVGSLEFIFTYIERYLGINKAKIKPLNIPSELNLYKYLGREIYFTSDKTLEFDKEMFAKSNDTYKEFTGTVTSMVQVTSKSNEYLISEVLDFTSEWRSFVYCGELVGLRNYCGDFTTFPNVNVIKNMITDYKESPLAYTLDVGITNTGTYLIEAHPFVSCGLYGFNNYKFLPQMFINGFKHLLILKNKRGY